MRPHFGAAGRWACGEDERALKEVNVLELDARGLMHPEPLERSVQMLRMLGDSNFFHLIIHRYPKPLLMIAKEHGVRFEVCGSDEDGWHILFAKNPNIDLKDFIKRYCSV